MTPHRSEMLVGFAAADFTPEPELSLFGQMHDRRATHAHDPLCANAVAFRQGGEAAVLVSVDVCVLPTPLVRQVQARFQSEMGLPGERLLIHATHTHDAPATAALLSASTDDGFLERLRGAIVKAAGAALDAARSADLFAGAGRLEHLGWNRRATFADGTSRMYGHSEMPGFTGIEGPRDPTLSLLWARDASGAVLGAVLSFSTHPNCLESECFYSADLPGEVRRLLRALLGPDCGVVYLTGAAGNTAPSLLDPHDASQPWRGEEGLRRSGLYLAGEAAQVIAACHQPMPEPLLHLETETLRLPLRPWPEEGDPCAPQPWDEPAADYYRRSREAWPRRLAEESPVEMRLNVLRLGDAAVCCNPAELFVEHGLALRQRSPAGVTLIAELTDGYVGYVPTRTAFERGGYETWPAPSSQLVPEAGDRIVEATAELLSKAFGQ